MWIGGVNFCGCVTWKTSHPLGPHMANKRVQDAILASMADYFIRGIGLRAFGLPVYISIDKIRVCTTSFNPCPKRIQFGPPGFCVYPFCQLIRILLAHSNKGEYFLTWMVLQY